LKVDIPGEDHPFKLVYSSDCRPTPTLIEYGKHCDLLIHECTYGEDSLRQAVIRLHTTSEELKQVHRRIKSKFTVITHFTNKFRNQRYPFDNGEFDGISNIIPANDFMTIDRSSINRLACTNDALKIIMNKKLQEPYEDFHYKIKFSIGC
jgi:ribonuclease Z